MNHVLNFRTLPGRALALLAALLLPLAAGAVEVPAPEGLRRLLGGEAPITIQVVEPHLSAPGKPVQVAYTGYPAVRVLDALLGPGWNRPGLEVEFRALDGYVSRVPAERFARYKAWLVHARPGQPEFTVDNITQNQKRVPLGPHYLVWDNVGSPELVAEGGSFWPYQVAQILSSSTRQDALLPGDMASRYTEHAALAQKHCLTCHQVNGYGGEKQPTNLARVVKGLSAEVFLQWVTEPGVVKPGTNMPPLPEGLPLAQRRDIADKLYAYLRALPVTR